MGQAEGLGSRVSGPDGWWGMSGKWSNPAQLPLSLYRVRIACEVDSCLSVMSRVEDEQCIGRPSISHTSDNVAKVKAVLDSDRSLSVRLIADQVGLPKSIVHEIITTELQMRKVCAKLVPKVLTDKQKESRVSISRGLLDRVRGDPEFLQQVITGDETWVFEYDSEMKRRSTEWHTTESP